MANDGGDVLDLEALRLPLVNGPAQQLERLDEKRCDEVRLKPAGIGPFHVLADLPNLRDIHRIMCQGATFDQFAKVLAVERLVDNLEKAGLHFGIVAVANGVEQQVA